MHKLENALVTLAASIKAETKNAELAEQALVLANYSNNYLPDDSRDMTDFDGIRYRVSADVAVLEARWQAESNMSVKPVFDLITQGYLRNRYDTIPYERFVGSNSLLEAIKYFKLRKHIQTIYIGTHGFDDKKNLSTPNESILNRAELRRAFAPDVSNIYGLYVGACWFCTEKNAAYFFDGDCTLDWFAGYESEADWGRSTFLDGLFFMEYIRQSQACQLATNRKRDIIKNVCDVLIEELKFNVFLTNKSKSQFENITRSTMTSPKRLASLPTFR
jgi:hypothetical protein